MPRATVFIARTKPKCLLLIGIARGGSVAILGVTWANSEAQLLGRPGEEGKRDMNYFVDFAGVAGAIGLSVALALWLEWVTLRGLMRLMPKKTVTSDDN